MQFRKSSAQATRIETQMAPMIDIVFQLLIFFMLTLKIIEPEGDFNINMPLGDPQQAHLPDPKFQDLARIRLVADDKGALAQLLLNDEPLGAGEEAFRTLNRRIRDLVVIGGKETEVEIAPDYNLKFRYSSHAVGACMGRFDRKTKSIVPYVEKITFKRPKRPE